MNSYTRMIKEVTTKYDWLIKRSTTTFCDYFKINQFWYNKIEDKGTLISFSNAPEWTEYFGEEKLYKKCPLLCHSSSLKNEFLFYPNTDIDAFVTSEIVQRYYGTIQTYSNMGWFVIVNKTEQGSEQFGFLVNNAEFSRVIEETPLI